MGKSSNIEWTDHTWNPWRGCKKISPGCANCYMFSEQRRHGNDPAKVTRCKPSTFNAPLHWRDPALVFTCSWSDFFIEEADAWRDDAWDIIRRTPHLTYQVLTKRPERIGQCLSLDSPLANVWLGVSVESPRYYDRIAQLVNYPATVRFLSLEPLLAPLPNLSYYLDMIDWVIVGGDSGPGARPMRAEWVIDIRNQCVAAGVPFFFKQWGGANKRRTGRLLDGVTHNGMPLVYELDEALKS